MKMQIVIYPHCQMPGLKPCTYLDSNLEEEEDPRCNNAKELKVAIRATWASTAPQQSFCLFFLKGKISKRLIHRTPTPKIYQSE